MSPPTDRECDLQIPTFGAVISPGVTVQAGPRRDTPIAANAARAR